MNPTLLPAFISVKHKEREYLRLSYHGGRVQTDNISVIFCETMLEDQRLVNYTEDWLLHHPIMKEKEPLYYLDINSSYPYIMTKALPCGQTTTKPINVNETDKLDCFALYRVDMFTFSQPHITSLPVVHKNGTILYPQTYNRDRDGKLAREVDGLLLWGRELKEACRHNGFRFHADRIIQW